jgi:hypothetical protein
MTDMQRTVLNVNLLQFPTRIPARASGFTFSQVCPWQSNCSEKRRQQLMETIKLLLAHSDRRVNNQVEVAILDVCYDLAVVHPTRTARLDEFARQGALWEFDLIIVGADNLYLDRNQQRWASPQEVAGAIQTIRSQTSTPIIVLTGNTSAREILLEAGAHSVLDFPFKSEQLKTEVRPLLHLGELVEADEPSGWSGIGSLFRGFQKARTND